MSLLTILPNLATLFDTPLDDKLIAYGGESAGIDLYAALPFGESIEILPMQNVTTGYPKTLIPTGIKIKCESNHVGLLHERGSIVKTGLKLRAGVIDPGYTGEIFVNCVNLTSSPITIKAGDKLPFQLLIVPFVHPIVVSKDVFELNTTGSLRKEGSIGSSDKV